MRGAVARPRNKEKRPSLVIIKATFGRPLMNRYTTTHHHHQRYSSYQQTPGVLIQRIYTPIQRDPFIASRIINKACRFINKKAHRFTIRNAPRNPIPGQRYQYPAAFPPFLHQSATASIRPSPILFTACSTLPPAASPSLFCSTL